MLESSLPSRPALTKTKSPMSNMDFTKRELEEMEKEASDHFQELLADLQKEASKEVQ